MGEVFSRSFSQRHGLQPDVQTNTYVWTPTPTPCCTPQPLEFPRSISCAHAGPMLAQMTHPTMLHARTWGSLAPPLLHAHMHTGTICAGSAEPQQLQQMAMADGSYCNMCNTRSTFATSRWITCNIQPKHLQHTFETLAKHLKTLESHCKHMQHTDETLITYVWKHMQHPDKTLATYVWKIDETFGTEAWNIRI
jgi:hypothetical protein